MKYNNYTENRNKVLNHFKESLSKIPEQDEVDIYLHPSEIKLLLVEGLIKKDPNHKGLVRFFYPQWVMADGSRPNTKVLQSGVRPSYVPAKRPAE